MYQCGRDSHLRRRFVRYSSVSLSPTLSRNEKVEQHIRKKTHKPNALRFWVEGGVIPLYVGSVLILVSEISPVMPPRIYPTRSIWIYWTFIDSNSASILDTYNNIVVVWGFLLGIFLTCDRLLIKKTLVQLRVLHTWSNYSMSEFKSKYSRMNHPSPLRTILAPHPRVLEDPSTCRVHCSFFNLGSSFNLVVKLVKHCNFIGPLIHT